MHYSAFPVLAYGALFLGGGILALALIVREDLVPEAIGGGGRRYFVGAALGFGLVSIAVKLTVIAMMSAFPRQVIDAQVPTVEQRTERADRMHEEAASPPTVVAPEQVPEARKWRPLPGVAPAPPGSRAQPRPAPRRAAPPRPAQPRAHPAAGFTRPTPSTKCCSSRPR